MHARWWGRAAAVGLVVLRVVRGGCVGGGSQTVCFDPCADPFMNKRSGCGPAGAQRDGAQSRCKAPQSRRVFPHTLTSEGPANTTASAA